MTEPRPWRYLYNQKAWHKLRAAQLRDEPLCRMCAKSGTTTAASIVDHVVPHKGDEALFYDRANLQSLCKTHHDAAKQRAEKRGVSDIGCDVNGWPIDPEHHWRR